MTLELLTEKYKAQIQELADDPQVSATSGVDAPCTLETVQVWIAKNQEAVPQERYFAILNDGEPVGGCALRYIDHEERSAYLGYWIGQRFWGQGLARQAAHLLRDYAFTELDLKLLHAMCLRGNNERSLRILQKVGFVPDESRDDLVATGRWGERFPGDVWGYYVLTRKQWVSMKNYGM